MLCEISSELFKKFVKAFTFWGEFYCRVFNFVGDPKFCPTICIPFGFVCFFNSVSHFLKLVKFIYFSYIHIFFCQKISIVSTSYKNSKCTFTVIRRAKLSQTGIRCYLWDIDILEQRLYLAYKIVLYNFSTAISRNTHKIYTLVSSVNL